MYIVCARHVSSAGLVLCNEGGIKFQAISKMLQSMTNIYNILRESCTLATVMNALTTSSVMRKVSMFDMMLSTYKTLAIQQYNAKLKKCSQKKGIRNALPEKLILQCNKL